MEYLFRNMNMNHSKQCLTPMTVAAAVAVRWKLRQRKHQKMN